MNEKLKGVKEIRTKVPQLLKLVREEAGGVGYKIYGAPEGHRLVLSGVFLAPPPWSEEIKEIWLNITGRTDRFFYHCHDSGGTILTDDEEPMLTIMETKTPRSGTDKPDEPPKEG